MPRGDTFALLQCVSNFSNHSVPLRDLQLVMYNFPNDACFPRCDMYMGKCMFLPTNVAVVPGVRPPLSILWSPEQRGLKQPSCSQQRECEFFVSERCLADSSKETHMCFCISAYTQRSCHLPLRALSLRASCPSLSLAPQTLKEIRPSSAISLQTPLPHRRLPAACLSRESLPRACGLDLGTASPDCKNVRGEQKKTHTHTHTKKTCFIVHAPRYRRRGHLMLRGGRNTYHSTSWVKLTNSQQTTIVCEKLLWPISQAVGQCRFLWLDVAGVLASATGQPVGRRHHCQCLDVCLFDVCSHNGEHLQDVSGPASPKKILSYFCHALCRVRSLTLNTCCTGKLPTASRSCKQLPPFSNIFGVTKNSLYDLPAAIVLCWPAMCSVCGHHAPRAGKFVQSRAPPCCRPSLTVTQAEYSAKKKRTHRSTLGTCPVVAGMQIGIFVVKGGRGVKPGLGEGGAGEDV